MKVNRIKQREQYVLDYYHKNIDKLEEKGKNKKKVIEAIKWKLKRNHSFHYISKHVGKGVRGNLKRLHEVNNRGQIINTYIDKESIKVKIMNYNVKHFTQAHQSEAHKDKIYIELRNPVIRNKILNGELNREECDSENV